ncbi:MAG TPA: hypothetical protein VEI97_19820, partial [bacterium]|nr:hypothetical protein [bacterium]
QKEKAENLIPTPAGLAPTGFQHLPQTPAGLKTSRGFSFPPTGHTKARRPPLPYPFSSFFITL